jgi:RimJ/RimL family protein N-acetyltransferase
MAGPADPVASFAALDGRRLPRLEARRVALRWPVQRDLPALFGIFSDPEVMRYWSALPLADRAGARRLLAEMHEGFADGTLFEWVIVRRDDDLAIGTCTLFHLDRENRRAEIGFTLARACWGQGLMTEALDRLAAFCLEELGLRRLEADVDPRNTASIRRLEGMGFRREGLLRERWNVGEEIQDAVFLGLLAREWVRPGR